MLAMVQAVIDLYSLRTLINFSSWREVKKDEIMTGKVENLPRKIYFRWSSNYFISKVGGNAIERQTLVDKEEDMSRDSKWCLGM